MMTPRERMKAVMDFKWLDMLLCTESSTTRPGLLIHLEDGFVAYDGLCTHMQAEVKWNKYTGKIWCTMHDGMYDPKTGRPFVGLPKEPLKKMNLRVEENGDIYAVL